MFIEPRAASSVGGAALLLLAVVLPVVSATATETPEPWGELRYLDVEVGPGESRRATWAASESFAGVMLATPVFIVRGTAPGPSLCLTAGIHGDELNGIEIVRRLLESIEADELGGTVIGTPIVNLHGFRRSSRYLPDRRDLNRYFPGRERGSSASRIADAFFRDVVRGCDMLVDMHTGSFHRANLPHVRADLSVPAVFEMARGFANTTIVHSVGTQGILRRAATEAGIPSITFEVGEPMRFEVADVERGVEGVRNLMRSKGMLKKRWRSSEPDVFRRSHWVRCDDGGILISEVELGERVDRGQLLGTVTDPLSNERALLVSPHPGVVIGMALNQVVMPGFAAFHLGIRPPGAVAAPGELEDWSAEAVEENMRESDERPE